MPPDEDAAAPVEQTGASEQTAEPHIDSSKNSGELHEIASADRESAARDLDRRIDQAMGETFELLAEAFRSGAWLTLGFASWNDYLASKATIARQRIPRAERAEMFGLLRDAGMSNRQIAAAVGVSPPTVDRVFGATDVATDDHGSISAPQSRHEADFVVDVLKNATPETITRIAALPRVANEASRQRNRHRPIVDPAPAEKRATSWADGIAYLLDWNIINQSLTRIADQVRRGMFDQLDSEVKDEALSNIARWERTLEYIKAFVEGHSITDEALDEWLR